VERFGTGVAAARLERAHGSQSVGALRQVLLGRRFVVRFTAACVLLSVIIALIIPNTYLATVRLMPPNETPPMLSALLGSSGSGSSAMGMVAADLLTMKNTGALFVGILRSRTVQDRIIGGFELRSVYKVRRQEQARLKLGENTSIVEDRKSGIITVDVLDRDPKRAAAIANAYAQELDRTIAQVNTSSARRQREFLETRLKAVKVDLDAADKALGEYSSSRSVIDVKEQAKAMLGAAASLQGELIAAKTELSGIQQIYTANNVKVKAMQARVAELERELQKVGGTTANEDTDIPSLRQLPLLGLTYADLYRRARIQEAVFETLTKQYELAKVEEAKETPSVRVLDQAEVPERKHSPPRAVIVLLSAIAAFGLACGIVLVRWRWALLDDDHEARQLGSAVDTEIRGSWRRVKGRFGRV
jgi:uncharacterized protein involved in exopolysaccharide biosynthesis